MAARFPNWPRLSELIDDNPHLAMAIILAHTHGEEASDTEKRLLAAFPEFFSETEVAGMIPISVIEGYSMQENDSMESLYEATDVFKIPTVVFCRYPSVLFEDAKPFQDELDGARVGQIVTFSDGSKWFIVEVEDNGDLIYACPADAIDLEH